MPQTLVVGTNNTHKLEEIAPYIEGLDVSLRVARDLGAFDPVEDGQTPEANAIIKARAALALSDEWSMADDTALEVDALDGRPGIYAARYAGEGCTFQDNIRKMLGELDGVPLEKRSARFICIIAFCRPNEAPRTFRGTLEGRIALQPQGGQGFGYDPIFLVDALGKTLAQLTREEKSGVSHRGEAMRMFQSDLKGMLARR